jgi:hypothetical protein
MRRKMGEERAPPLRNSALCPGAERKNTKRDSLRPYVGAARQMTETLKGSYPSI